MLTVIVPCNRYSHFPHDQFQLVVECNASAAVAAAAICGNPLVLPDIGPIQYDPCPDIYIIALVVRFFDDTGSAAVKLIDAAGAEIDSCPVAPPATTPNDVFVNLRFAKVTS